MEDALVVHVGGEAGEGGCHGLPDGFVGLSELIETVGIGAVDADEIAVAEQAEVIALFKVGHGFGCGNVAAEEEGGVAIGAESLGLAQ